MDQVQHFRTSRCTINMSSNITYTDLLCLFQPLFQSLCPPHDLCDAGATLHRRGHGFISRSSLNFFQVFSQQSGCVDNCENLFFYILFHSQCLYIFICFFPFVFKVLWIITVSGSDTDEIFPTTLYFSLP